MSKHAELSAIAVHDLATRLTEALQDDGCSVALQFDMSDVTTLQDAEALLRTLATLAPLVAQFTEEMPEALNRLMGRPLNRDANYKVETAAEDATIQLRETITAIIVAREERG